MVNGFPKTYQYLASIIRDKINGMILYTWYNILISSFTAVDCVRDKPGDIIHSVIDYLEVYKAS